MTTFQTNRRQLLMGLALSSIAASTATTAPAKSAENPDLLALADDLPALVEDYATAHKAVQQITAKYAKVWPLAPEPILQAGFLSGTERDVTGAGISRLVENRSPKKQVFSFGTPEHFESEIAYWRKEAKRRAGLKTKRGLHRAENKLREAEEALPLSREYCAEIERLRKEAGYEMASKREKEARDALCTHIGAIMEAKPATMEGVLIQAEALKAWGQVERFYRALEPKALNWPLNLASSIMAQAAEA